MQQEVKADNPEEKFQATENIDRICKDLDSGLSV
jgi:hypothetical protein